MMANHITFLGDDSRTGTYILWITVRADLAVTFGRFRQGNPIPVPAGTVAYVGSAMGARGSTSLAGRLLRHATRTGDRPPHAIRAGLLSALQAAGLVTPEVRPPAAKRLRWHVDYLLDEVVVELAGITIVRTAMRLESDLARALPAVPGIVPLAPGLGAGDAPGESHLLRCPAPDLPEHAAALIARLLPATG